MRDITIDGVTLTYDKDLDYYIEYGENGSIDRMIDGSFGEDEAIRIFKDGRAEYRLLKKFIDDFGYQKGFEKWCNFSTSDRETLYNKLVMEHCLDCDMFYFLYKIHYLFQNLMIFLINKFYIVLYMMINHD